MGTLALAAKITHVPSMYLSEMDGPAQRLSQGCNRWATKKFAVAVLSSG